LLSSMLSAGSAVMLSLFPHVTTVLGLPMVKLSFGSPNETARFFSLLQMISVAGGPSWTSSGLVASSSRLPQVIIVDGLPSSMVLAGSVMPKLCAYSQSEPFEI
jgi:hypothetical protein